MNGQSVQQQFAQGTHHCLVAEIAFKGAPIRNVGGTVETADNSDKLAQRNLQVTTSGQSRHSWRRIASRRRSTSSERTQDAGFGVVSAG